ncbi:MAG: Ig-like domain-containing protein [Bythopirellula sp.]|nr:Ig-like domain-containing protein [Bythopirellula sp.]
MLKRTCPTRSKTKRYNTLRFEHLEPRLALDAEGSILGTDVHLTLSFAADGTSIAGQTNELASLFDAIAPRAVWQEKILTAFQTWAVHTNADIGVVSDGGQAFGSGGASQEDSRFGDIRIGAIEMASNVAAVSVPVDGIVSGTWFADVLFNTAYNYQTIDDILAIALHEAGNVFALEDNNDPNSPLFSGDPPVVREPTATDIALLQQLHGVRAPDLNEVSLENGNVTTNNDTITSASELLTGEFNESGQGSAPTVVYGDIGANTDHDFFFIDPPSNYGGALTVEVRSLGISLLKPRLRVFDQNQVLVAEGVSAEFGGDRLTVNLPSINQDQRYYFQVSSSDGAALNVGGYSLVVAFDDENLATPAQIDELAGGAYRHLPADELAEFFDSEEDFFNDDDHTDDTILSAVDLETFPGFAEGIRYRTIGSIDDATDVDFYAVDAPELLGTPLDVMTISLRSLEFGGLIPQITVLDEDSNIIPAIIIANGAGDFIVQVEGIIPDEDYLIKVAAANPGQLFDTGNYNLVVSFASDVVAFESLGLDPLPALGNGTTQNLHTFYVGKPQLFHFVVEAENVAVSTPTVLVATIYDDQNQPVYQLSTRPGETRSREAVLLAPGTYTMRVVVLTLNGSVPPEIQYDIRWAAISDPFVGDPNDPTANPFACSEPGLEGFFCYPGDIISEDPTLWDTFIESFSTPPTDFDPAETLTTLFGDWWTWVWAAFSTNGPVFANDDQYNTASGAALTVTGNLSANLLSAFTVGQANGLLANDIDPEGGDFVALLSTNVSHGTLVLQPDGGFTYTPNPGFQGMDLFTYIAYDFANQSNTGTVRIIVGNSADFNGDGGVSGRDFLAWQRGYGISGGATLADGDANGDLIVDGLDLAIWQDQYPGSTTPEPSQGDADADGDIDGRDFLAWQRGVGISSGALPADGDANGDQAVNALDLEIWQQNYGTSPLLAGFTDVAAISLESDSAQQFAAVSSEPSQTLPINVETSLTATANSFHGFLMAPTLAGQSTEPLRPASISTATPASLASGLARERDQQLIDSPAAATLPSEFDPTPEESASDNLSSLVLAWDQFAEEMVQGAAEAYTLARSPRVLRRWLGN